MPRIRYILSSVFLAATLPLVGPFLVGAFGASPGSVRGVAVEAVHFSADDALGDRVCIVLNDHEVPVMGVIEGERPRVFMDFLQVTEWKGPDSQTVKGRFVQRIRAHLYTGSGRLRIVLDMVPDYDFFVAQRYFTQEHIFCLWVSDHPLEKPAAGSGPGLGTESR